MAKTIKLNVDACLLYTLLPLDEVELAEMQQLVAACDDDDIYKHIHERLLEDGVKFFTLEKDQDYTIEDEDGNRLFSGTCVGTNVDLEKWKFFTTEKVDGKREFYKHYPEGMSPELTQLFDSYFDADPTKANSNSIHSFTSRLCSDFRCPNIGMRGYMWDLELDFDIDLPEGETFDIHKLEMLPLNMAFIPIASRELNVQHLIYDGKIYRSRVGEDQRPNADVNICWLADKGIDHRFSWSRKFD